LALNRLWSHISSGYDHECRLALGSLYDPVVLAAAAKVWIAISRFSSHSGEPWVALSQAILAAALAMIGPGAWSIDARRYGRKRIDLSEG
jgi:hypothetical protein